MKKILYLIASAALLLTACGKEKQEVGISRTACGTIRTTITTILSNS